MIKNLLALNSNKLTYILFSLLLFIFIIFLIFYHQIYFYINPVSDIKGNIFKFADWTVIPDAISCSKKGFNVYELNPCDVSQRPHIYGKILLYLPFVEEFYFFYVSIFPLILNFLIILAITFLFNPKKKFDYLIIFLIVLSTPILLSLERANSEQIIFLFIILIAYIRNFFLIQFFIYIISSIKFYPFIATIIFLYEKIKFKKYLNISISIFLFIITITLNFSEIRYVIENNPLPPTIENVGMYIFSFHAFSELAKSTVSVLKIFDEENILLISKYFLAFCLFLMIIINSIFISKLKIYKNLNYNYFEERLFLLSAVMLCVIFFFPSMNYVYKEIYFIGLIPFIKKNYDHESSYFKYFYILLISKFLILTILWIFQTTFFENSLYVKGFNILFKNIFDNFLLVILSSFLIIFSKDNFFFDFKKKKYAK